MPEPIRVLKVVVPVASATGSGKRSVAGRLRGAFGRFGRRRTALAALAALGVAVAALITLHPAQGPARDSFVAQLHIGKTASIRSLAVLPLDDFNMETEAAFFADGMTDALITDLTKIEGLRVISRTTTMRYKNHRNMSLRDIARELGVDGIIDGSFQRSGRDVVVSVRLYRAKNEENVWSERFERSSGDVLLLQGGWRAPSPCK